MVDKHEGTLVSHTWLLNFWGPFGSRIVSMESGVGHSGGDAGRHGGSGHLEMCFPGPGQRAWRVAYRPEADNSALNFGHDIIDAGFRKAVKSGLQP